MTGTAAIVDDPSTVTPAALVDAVRETGYGSDLPSPVVPPPRSRPSAIAATKLDYHSLRWKALGSLVVATATMVLSMPLMLASEHAHDTVADPFMQWTMRQLAPPLCAAAPRLFTLDPSWLWYGLLVLTLGVMAWAGRHFYVRAWAAARHGAADMNTLIAIGTSAAFLYSAVVMVAPGVFLRARPCARCLLRGGGHHHRLHPDRQRARGAGEEQTSSRAARPCGAAAETARVSRDGTEPTCRSSGSAATTR